MGPGGMRPGRDPPVRTEVVHENARARVTRVFFAGRTVIGKQPLGPDAGRRLPGIVLGVTGARHA
jgi:hypothetical protein